MTISIVNYQNFYVYIFHLLFICCDKYPNTVIVQEDKYQLSLEIIDLCSYDLIFQQNTFS